MSFQRCRRDSRKLSMPGCNGAMNLAEISVYNKCARTKLCPNVLSAMHPASSAPLAGQIGTSHGHQGGPLATTDGGATWTSQYAAVETSRPLMDMRFLNAQTGFLLAEANRNNLVLATSNGGKSWRSIGNVEKYSTALSFPLRTRVGWWGPKGTSSTTNKVLPGQ